VSVKKGQEADLFSGASMLYVGLAALVMCLLAIFYLTGNLDIVSKMVEGAKMGRVEQQQTSNSAVQGLTEELGTTVDDGGESQVQQLKNDARGL